MKKRKPSYLTFKLDKELYAVSTLKLVEVLDNVYITPIPNSFDYLHGVIPFRGNIIPVINLHRKMEVERKLRNKNVIIIFEVILKMKKTLVAALVDGVREVLTVDDEHIKPLIDDAINVDQTYFLGMISNNDNFILIMNIEKVFAIKEE